MVEMCNFDMLSSDMSEWRCNFFRGQIWAAKALKGRKGYFWFLIFLILTTYGRDV